MTLPDRLPVRRNTALLSAALAANSGMLQLSAAVASLTLVLVIGIDGLLGLGPAIVLASGALAALPAGRAMDRVGRVPVLAGGFVVGAAGSGLAALGSTAGSAPLVLAGLICVGAASGTALLARTAAADMYPPERRARGIALVLFGAVFGAILGPTVFSPLLSGRDLDGDALAVLWLAAGGFMVVGLVLVLCVRPDPRRIAQLLHTDAGGGAALAAAPLRELLGRPGVIPALLAAQASFGVMVGVMTLTGAVVVDHHHHEAHHVFPIIGAHVVGMYALVLVIGDVIDRIGRTPALGGGLLVMAVSVISLLWVESVPAVAVALFGLGVGWNLSFVAATAELADCTHAWERGTLLGFNDLLSGLTGAGLALLGGYALTALGVAALAIGGAALVLAPRRLDPGQSTDCQHADLIGMLARDKRALKRPHESLRPDWTGVLVQRPVHSRMVRKSAHPGEASFRSGDPPCRESRPCVATRPPPRSRSPACSSRPPRRWPARPPWSPTRAPPSGTMVRYQDPGNESNNVFVTYDVFSQLYTIAETAGVPVTAVLPCVNIDAFTATCPDGATATPSAEILAGNANDVVNASGRRRVHARRRVRERPADHVRLRPHAVPLRRGHRLHDRRRRRRPVRAGRRERRPGPVRRRPAGPTSSTTPPLGRRDGRPARTYGDSGAPGEGDYALDDLENGIGGIAAPTR